MIKNYNTSNPIQIVKYDGSKESVKDIKYLCKTATEDDKKINFKVSLLGPPNDSLSLEVTHCEYGIQTSFAYSNNEQYILYDKSKKNWDMKIVICNVGYINSEYRISMLEDKTIEWVEIDWSIQDENKMIFERDKDGKFYVVFFDNEKNIVRKKIGISYIPKSLQVILENFITKKH